MSDWRLNYQGRRYDVILDLSTEAADAALDTLSALMDGGAIELLSSTGDLLCELQLSNPATSSAVNGSVSFNEIGVSEALADGDVVSARIVGSGGDEVMVLDVGGMESDAVIRLNTTTFQRGSAVMLDSFKLAMP